MDETRFNLTVGGMTLLASSMTAGALYHLSNEKIRDKDLDRGIGRCMLDLTAWMTNERAEKGYFELSHDESMLLLLAVSSAKYFILELDRTGKGNYAEICERFDIPKEILRAITQRKSSFALLKTTSILLDYLECACPKVVRNKWFTHKKNVTTDMFNDMVEMYDAIEEMTDEE